MWLNFSIALRYIKSKRREKVISVIAAFSLIGIILGVATLIIVTSVMNGFRKEFTEKVIGFNGHLTVYPNSGTDYEKMKKEILKIPGVKQAIPVIERQGLLMTDRSVRGSLIYGISFEDLTEKKLIANNIKMGDLQNFKKQNAILLGDPLAIKSNLYVDDDVTVLVPEMNKTGFGTLPRKKTFRLAATFNSGMHEYDNSVSYIPLKLAQKLFKLGNGVTSISIFVEDPMQISQIKKQLQKKYGSRVTDWQSSNSSFMKAIEIERNVMFLILLLITLVASFNIISCMIMLVKDKEKDIAILRTMGITKNSILKIFFIVGASIGVVGTCLGTALGLLFSINIQRIQDSVDKIFNTQVFSPEVYFLTHLPSLLRWEDVALTVAISLLISCFATFYPARKASKLNPVEILRYV